MCVINMSSSIKYIDIKHSFAENSYNNHKIVDINEFVNLITKDDDSYSIFEIIENYKQVKMYFDIENIPTENDKLIFEIVKTLIIHLNEFFNIPNFETEKVEYIITENKHSHTHEGRSYHIIFCNVITNQYATLNYLKYYVTNKFIGNEYIDLSVYSKNRLFRSINQPGVDKNDRYGQLLSDDKHFIIYPEKVNNDIIKESVITYPKTMYEIKYNCNACAINKSVLKSVTKEFRKMKPQRNYSNDNKTVGNKQIFIFNQPIDKNGIETLIGKNKNEDTTNETSYNNSIDLSELIEANKKLTSELHDFKEYNILILIILSIFYVILSTLYLLKH